LIGTMWRNASMKTSSPRSCRARSKRYPSKAPSGWPRSHTIQQILRRAGAIGGQIDPQADRPVDRRAAETGEMPASQHATVRHDRATAHGQSLDRSESENGSRFGRRRRDLRSWRPGCRSSTQP
jgi:hypothetical protein